MSQGTQKILYQFQTPLDSDYLNSAFQDIFSIGIYSGFTVNILGDTSVQVNVGKYIISDDTYMAIIENQASATITIGSATPYIIIRWSYLKQANNFAVISAVAHASILSTDIIIGKGIYNGSTLDSISYTQQTKPVKILSENLFDNLKVLENSTPAMNVIVNAGVIVSNDGARHVFSSTTTKTISAADATHPRIDLIAVDTSGVIQVVAGTPAASPAAPSYSNYFVLAEVYVAANVTAIYQDNITDVRNFFTSALTFASIFNAISGLSTLDPLLSTDELPINRSNVGYKFPLSTLYNYIATNYIENLEIENTTSSITVMAGLKIVVNNKFYTYGSDQTPSLTAIDAAIGAGGYAWCALCVSETDGTISAQLLGNGLPGFSNSIVLGFSNGITKDLENQLALYGKYDNTYGYVRSQINGTGTWYRIIAVFKRIVGFTDATVDSSSGFYSFNCDSTVKLTVGMSVSQSGSADIPANAEIVEITSATQFRLNVTATATHTNIPMDIASDILSIIKVEKKPKTFIKMYQNIVSTGTLTNSPVILTVIEIDINSEISGNSTTRLYTASNLKKINYMSTGKTYNGSGSSIYFIYKNSKLYKTMDFAHGANRVIENLPAEIFWLKKGSTLQLKETQPDSGGNNPGNYPRDIGLIIEEIE
jgi:hypothetical protein